MEQKSANAFAGKNEMILKGQIVEATEKFFSDQARTIDFDGTVTQNKQEIISKMENFVGAISVVNTIKMHRAAMEGQVSFAEYTFDFDMKDGSKILWHEIIRSVWED